MSSETELQEFHRFLGERIRCGTTGLSLDDVLEEWRAAHADPETLSQDMRAIEVALADMDAGDQGMLLEDFDRQIRLKHGFESS